MPKGDALAREVRQLIVAGTLRGPGIWQRDVAKPQASQQALPVQDDADAHIMDGYRYTAHLMPSRPRLAQAPEDGPSPDAEADARVRRACPRSGSHLQFYVEREGGIAGAKALAGPLVAYVQVDRTLFCACPAAALAERLPLCCASLCKT